jgi:Uma2 family endonuclease
MTIVIDATLIFVAASNPYADVTVVPKIAIRLPLALPAPAGFDVERLETWPEVTGRLEYVHGEIEYMPPCGELQQRTTADVVTELTLWARTRGDFVVGSNEAGMLLGGEVRAADAAVWNRASLGAPSGGFARVPPVLAVEVTGPDESAEDLAPKVAWYLAHGVSVVWVVVPTERCVAITTGEGTRTLAAHARVPVHPLLPGLEPAVATFFRQL